MSFLRKLYSVTQCSAYTTRLRTLKDACACTKVRCHGSGKVYLDGQDAGMLRINVTWSRDTSASLIAVRCQRTKGLHGLIVSADQTLISDSSWKCFEAEDGQVVEEMWYKKSFDDSSWAAAHVLETNGESAERKIDDVPDYANWIWKTGTGDSNNETVYCRGWMGVLLHVYHCNDNCTIYADGKKIGRSGTNGNWSSTISKTSRLIGVEVESNGDVPSAGISVSNGFQSDASHLPRWRCSAADGSATWRKIDFKDDDWAEAVLAEDNPSSISGTTHDNTTGMDRGQARSIACSEGGSKIRFRGHFECNCPGAKKCNAEDDGVDCKCPEGYEEGEGEGDCEDINECNENNPCDVAQNQTCENVPGSYQCRCPLGFSLNHTDDSCVDNDECQNATACDGPRDCHNSPGSYSCVCRLGYTPIERCPNAKECRSGSLKCAQNCSDSPSEKRVSCVDVDECSSSNGGCTHSCNNTNGSFFCSCLKGYTLAKGGRICTVDQDRFISATLYGGTSGALGVLVVIVLITNIFLLVNVIRRRRGFYSAREKTVPFKLRYNPQRQELTVDGPPSQFEKEHINGVGATTYRDTESVADHRDTSNRATALVAPPTAARPNAYVSLPEATSPGEYENIDKFQQGPLYEGLGDTSEVYANIGCPEYDELNHSS